MKVVCLVANPISKDARVQKEANAIKDFGHEVIVVGLQDKNNNVAYEKNKNGVEYYRLPWKSYAYRRVARFALWVGFAMLVAMVIAYKLLENKTIESLNNQLYSFFNSLVTAFLEMGAIGHIFIIFGGLICLKALRVSKAYKNISMRYARTFEQELPIREDVVADKSNFWGVFLSRFKSIGVQLLVRRFRDNAFSSFAIKLKPDVVHCHDITTLRAGVKIKAKTKAKLVYDAHEYYEDTAGLPSNHRKLYRIIHTLCNQQVDLFIVVNKYFGELYKKKYRGFNSPVVVMNALNQPMNIDYDGRLHHAAGLKLDTKILLFQGGFTLHRGIERLIDAAIKLPQDWCLVMMGWGRLEEPMKQRLMLSNNGNNLVKFLPPAPQDELMKWTAGATVGIIPYEDEGINHKYCTPNKLWEFPAAGVPFIATPRVVMKDMIHEYRHGEIIEDNYTVQELIGALKKISENHAEYKKNCIRFVEENSWEKNKIVLKQEYEKIQVNNFSARNLLRSTSQSV